MYVKLRSSRIAKCHINSFGQLSFIKEIVKDDNVDNLSQRSVIRDNVNEDRKNEGELNVISYLFVYLFFVLL